MFKKDKDLADDVSMISRSLCIVGNLVCGGTLEIDGTVEGDIEGNIVSLRNDSKVKGKIIAKVLNVSGSFVGVAICGKINIAAKAVVKGTLEYGLLCIEDGAIVEGDIKKISDKSGKTVIDVAKQGSKNE